MRTFLISIIRLYCRHVPIHIGKGFLMRMGRRILLLGLKNTSLMAHSLHGVSMEIELPRDAGWDVLYFRGTYETGTTKVFELLIRDLDRVFDIGANMGWYSIISSRLARHGEVHAFEPVPFIFEKFKKNISLNNENDIHVNNIALGREKHGSIAMHTFDGLYHGHSSMSTLNRTDYTTVHVPMTTLDSYCEEHGIGRIDFIKMDTEGAEMEVLAGAKQLMSGSFPPIWLIELNDETCAAFGYKPHQLIDQLCSYHKYELYVIQGAWGRVRNMRDSHDYEHGDNLLCIPQYRSDALEQIKSLF
ncbi:MAG: FkbM family methyltransferase [Ignavibacteria bacterium]|jgi:FkbM family methyltransferase